jgi:hypothetical protein
VVRAQNARNTVEKPGFPSPPSRSSRETDDFRLRDDHPQSPDEHLQPAEGGLLNRFNHLPFAGHGLLNRFDHLQFAANGLLDRFDHLPSPDADLLTKFDQLPLHDAHLPSPGGDLQ